jgi:hypothetical protein
MNATGLVLRAFTQRLPKGLPSPPSPQPPEQRAPRGGIDQPLDLCPLQALFGAGKVSTQRVAVTLGLVRPPIRYLQLLAQRGDNNL